MQQLYSTLWINMHDFASFDLIELIFSLRKSSIIAGEAGFGEDYIYEKINNFGSGEFCRRLW
mgnify:CR=1 FL=1